MPLSKWLRPHTIKQRVCSEVCRKAARRAVSQALSAARRQEWAPQTTGECQWCFAAVGATARYCSKSCRAKRNHHWNIWKAPDRCHLPVCFDCGRLCGFNPIGVRRLCGSCQEKADAWRRDNSEARRRKAARSGDTIHWSALGERDGWICHLCGKTVPQRPGKADTPTGATVDHLIPISGGGTHTWDNVALAHRKCNLSRGARGTVQLRLVG